MGAWVIGHNVSGYLPEATTYAFAEWEDARQAFADEARRYADEDDEATDAAYDGADYSAMRATVDSILEDDGPRNGKPFAMWVESGSFMRITFWLEWEEAREPDSDDDN